VDAGIQIEEKKNNLLLSQEMVYTLKHTEMKIIFPILMGKRVWIQLEKQLMTSHNK